MSAFRDELLAMLPNLRRFALSLTGSFHDGEDLVQTAIERALRQESAWDGGSRLEHWMFRVIKNSWIDELRAKRRRNVSLDGIGEISGEDGRDVTEHRLDLDAARHAFLQLPAEQRAVFCLVVLEGMSYIEAATALDVPIGTVMSRLSRARAAIAIRLAGAPAHVVSTRSAP